VNPVDQLRAWCVPHRLLHAAEADGRGVRVALLDTGIDRVVLSARHGARAWPGLRFWLAPPQADAAGPSAPHGTVVADILLRLAPACVLHSADVFGPTGVSNVETLVQALDYAVDEWQCQIVNLSLGLVESQLTKPVQRQMLQRAIERAYHRDVLIVAAAHNNHPFTRSVPAVWAPPLLSVDKQLFADAFGLAYAPREQVEFQAHGQGYVGDAAREPATSWAAPHLAGLAARLLSLRPGLKPFEVKTLLYWLATSPTS
jgi:subtilisin family serine protease